MRHGVEIYLGGDAWEMGLGYTLSSLGETHPLSELVRGQRPVSAAVIVATAAEIQGIPPRLVDRIADSVRLILIKVNPKFRLSSFFRRILHAEIPPLKTHQLLPLLKTSLVSAIEFLRTKRETVRLSEDLERLNKIGAALSSMRDSERLMSLILSSARSISNCDAGSLYLVDHSSNSLIFMIAQNDSMNYSFSKRRIPLTRSSIAGYVALSGQEVLIEDAYKIPPNMPFGFNRDFDRYSGYRTVNVLAVPIKNQKGIVLGVLQLINRKESANMLLKDKQAIPAMIRRFDERTRDLLRSLASQAGVAIENTRLYEDIQRLFEGFVEASVSAIESRDPATMGHSKRVAKLSVELARAINDTEQGALAGVHFSDSDIDEIRFAALLHDFGKVAVPESVLLKSTKAYELFDEVFGLRIKLARQMLIAEELRLERDILIEGNVRQWEERVEDLHATLQERLLELERLRDFIIATNHSSKVDEADRAKISALANTALVSRSGEFMLLLTPKEAEALSIPYGNLLPEERKIIQSHVYHTYKFLSRIPWSKELERIPEFAYSHHEKLNGKGYPRGLRGSEIPIQARIIALADMFDALMSLDRSYKKAIPLDRTLNIIQAEVESGGLDRHVFEIFLKNRVYERIHQAG